MKRVTVLFYLLLIFALYMYISISYVETTDMGDGYIYNSECHHITGNIELRPEVVCCTHNQRFIVAVQKPESKYPNSMYNQPSNGYSKGIDAYYFWIIDKKNGTSIGPIHEEDLQNLHLEDNGLKRMVFDMQKKKNQIVKEE